MDELSLDYFLREVLVPVFLKEVPSSSLESSRESLSAAGDHPSASTTTYISHDLPLPTSSEQVGRIIANLFEYVDETGAVRDLSFNVVGVKEAGNLGKMKDWC